MAQYRKRLTAKDLKLVTIQAHGEAAPKTRATSKRVPADVVNPAGVALCSNAEHDASDRGTGVHRLDVAVGLEERFLVINIERDRLGDRGHFAVDVALSATSMAVTDDTKVGGLLAVASHSLEDHAVNSLQRLLLPLKRLGLQRPELLGGLDIVSRFEVFRRLGLLCSGVLSHGRDRRLPKKDLSREPLSSPSTAWRRWSSGGHGLVAGQLRRRDDHIIKVLGRAERWRSPGARLHTERRVVKARGGRTWVIVALAGKAGRDPSSVGVGSEVALTWRRSRLRHRDGKAPVVVQMRIEVNEEECSCACCVWWGTEVKMKGGRNLVDAGGKWQTTQQTEGAKCFCTCPLPKGAYRSLPSSTVTSVIKILTDLTINTSSKCVSFYSQLPA